MDFLKRLLQASPQAEAASQMAPLLPNPDDFNKSQLIDDGGYTRNVLMKGIPGMEDQSPSFSGPGGVAFAEGPVAVTKDDLPASPIKPELQALMPAAKSKIMPVQQMAAQEFKEEGKKEKAAVAKHAEEQPVESTSATELVPETKEPSALEKLLAQYNSPQEEDTELSDALARRADLQRQIAMLRGFQQVGAGIGGYKTDKDFLSDAAQLSGQEVADLEKKRESATKKRGQQREEIKFGMDAEKFAMDMDKARAQMADEDAKRNPNSEISRITKDSIANMFDRIGRKEQADQIRASKLSSKQLDDVYGQMNIQNYISMYEAQQSRLQAERIAAQSRKDAKADKEESAKEREKEKLTTHISDKIKSVDDKVGYNKALSDYEMLNQRLTSGTFDSMSDVAAVYALMKALDPGSVVRETEFETLVNSQGGFEKFKRMPDRFFKGNIFSPEVRKKLLNQFNDVVDARRKQLKKVLEPDLKRAKELGIKEDYIISPATVKSFEQSAAPVSVAEGAAAELARRRQGK